MDSKEEISSAAIRERMKELGVGYDELSSKMGITAETLVRKIAYANRQETSFNKIMMALDSIELKQEKAGK